jgi:hypothetical protein
VTLVSPVTSNNTPRLAIYVQRNWWWLPVTWGNSAKWAASVCFMEYLTTYGLNAMEIVQSNFFLGYIYIYVIRGPHAITSWTKERGFTCHISCILLPSDIFVPPYAFGTFLIVGCTNLITHALLCPIPHKLNAPIQWVMSNNQHAQAHYPVHNSFRIAHGCLKKI